MTLVNSQQPNGLIFGGIRALVLTGDGTRVFPAPPPVPARVPWIPVLGAVAALALLALLLRLASFMFVVCAIFIGPVLLLAL